MAYSRKINSSLLVYMCTSRFGFYGNLGTQSSLERHKYPNEGTRWNITEFVYHD